MDCCFVGQMSTEDFPLTPTPTERGPVRIDVYEPAGYVLARAYRPYYKQVLQLPIRDDDVWVVSHPKCGTYLYHLDFSHINSNDIVKYRS